jgi:hypothetical protein
MKKNSMLYVVAGVSEVVNRQPDGAVTVQSMITRMKVFRSVYNARRHQAALQREGLQTSLWTCPIEEDFAPDEA